MQLPPSHLRLVESEHSAGRPTPERSSDPIAELELDHALQLELCDILEQIADGLPQHTTGPLTKVAIEVLRVSVPAHMAIEDDALFPLLKMRGESVMELQPILAQLRHEHDVDLGYAYEMADELESLATAGRAVNPEMLGYMLRGFFTTQRRHIEWENATIVPLARRLLTVDDLIALNTAALNMPRAAEARERLLRLSSANTEQCSGTCPDCERKKNANQRSGEPTCGQS